MITHTSDRVDAALGFVGVLIFALLGFAFVAVVTAGAYEAWADALDRTCLVSK